MRLWTNQPLEVWKRLQKQETLYVDPNSKHYRGYLPPAYQWLQAQLSARVPHYDGHLPWWAYGEKPDLRSHRHRLYGKQVRMELEPGAHNVICFPSWTWHTVYTQDYLTTCPREYETWWMSVRRAVPDENRWPLPKPWRGQLERSWRRLFDPDLPRTHWDRRLGSFITKGSMVAVIGVLRIQEVRKVNVFQGTGSVLESAKRLARRTRHIR